MFTWLKFYCFMIVYVDCVLSKNLPKGEIVKSKIEEICGDNLDLFVGNIFDNKFTIYRKGKSCGLR